MSKAARPRSPGSDGPPARCPICDSATLWAVQGQVSRTVEVPPNDPPTYVAAGPWACMGDRRHGGLWVHTTTDPMPYLIKELAARGLPLPNSPREQRRS